MLFSFQRIACMEPVPSRFIVFAAALAILSWSSAYPIVRIALPEIAAIPLAAARYGLAATLALGWLLYHRPPFPARRDWLRFVLCGAIGITIYNILFNTGEQTVSAGAASLIISAAPLLATLIAVFLMGEQLSAWGWIGSLTSFSGVAMIVLGMRDGLSFGSGAVLVIGCAISGAIYTTAQKALVRRYGALTTTAYVLIVGALLLSPWWPQAVDGLARASWHTRAAVIELGIFPAALGYAAWAYVIGIRGAARTATLLYLLPPTTIVLAFFLTGEIPTVNTLAGGAVVMTGVFITNRFGKKTFSPVKASCS